ncbi:hypothetical protein KIPB_011945, partial [Kipferlia bialata]
TLSGCLCFASLTHTNSRCPSVFDTVQREGFGFQYCHIPIW